MKILSVPQGHCESHNNFMKFFKKNYTLYGFYIFINFGFRLNLLKDGLDLKKSQYIVQIYYIFDNKDHRIP